MHGDEQVVELLNEVLTAELTAMNQYFLDAKMIENWGYEPPGKRFRSESTGEMQDADLLIERILYLQGHPNVQRLHGVRRAKNSVLLEQILKGEETHADWLETQLELIGQIGDANYLAQQIQG
jgi:bacterioferritin